MCAAALADLLGTAIQHWRDFVVVRLGRDGEFLTGCVRSLAAYDRLVMFNRFRQTSVESRDTEIPLALFTPVSNLDASAWTSSKSNL